LPERLLLADSPEKFARVHREPAPRNLSISGNSVWKIKRAIDIFFTVVTLLLLSPVAILVALLVLVDVGYPVVFWQQRVGRFRRPLHVYKFRTMRSPFDIAGRPVSESQRLSSIGRFLRATRLDEIPQLWNILTGEMSVVGPRPLLPIDQPKTLTTRLYVRPGLTGLAQISGGKLLSIEEKDAIDEHYVRQCSILLEICILVRTLWVVLRGDKRNETIIAAALAEKRERSNAINGSLLALETSGPPCLHASSVIKYSLPGAGDHRAQPSGPRPRRAGRSAGKSDGAVKAPG
jgi:lipopolysaccharide/colanic/teichoic acid biosynthesis glycosyltransferase